MAFNTLFDELSKTSSSLTEVFSPQTVDMGDLSHNSIHKVRYSTRRRRVLHFCRACLIEGLDPLGRWREPLSISSRLE